jgi:hypothetical protein
MRFYVTRETYLLRIYKNSCRVSVVYTTIIYSMHICELSIHIEYEFSVHSSSVSIIDSSMLQCFKISLKDHVCSTLEVM